LKNEGFDIPDELSCTFLDLPNRKTAIKYLLEVFNQKTNPINKESLDDWFVLEEIEDIEVEVDWLNVEELEEVEVEELEAQEDDFEEPEPNQIKTDIVKGDIFEFRKDGKTLHRLLCGDSTDSDSVAKLMNGNKADISFTSPPYNTKENAKLSPHQSNGTKYNSYSDDLEDDEYLKLLTDFTNNSLLFSDYSFVNIQSLSGNKTALIDYLYNLKSIYADTLIWNKQNAQPAMANNVLNSQFEYVHCFSHKANRAIGTKEFRGTISNVIDISKQSANKIKEHNATFPVDFANFFVSNFSNNSVLDLFCGSGSTMVAAHQLKRKCYGMELDEKYCQVIVDRMKKLDPELEIVKI
jgi:DNA modification methylase